MSDDDAFVETIQQAAEHPRVCTCHPDDRPLACQHKYATRECKRADMARKAGLFEQGANRIFDDPKTNGDMWYAELIWFLRDVKAEMEL